MYEHEGGRNPVWGAPGSNNFAGLIASSTNAKSGSEPQNFQGLSDEDANDLCKRYLPLAYKTAGKYRDRGIDLDELRSAGIAGLVEASRKYDPQRGPFGPYAKSWIKGGITALFKEAKRKHAESLDATLPSDRRDDPDKPRTLADKLAYIAPVGALDMHELAEVDRKIIHARDAGETLEEVGKANGLSPEHVRQRETRARKRLKGAIAAICISDLTSRGDILPFPGRYSWGDADFRDTPPPKHAYREPLPSNELRHHRKHAAALAELRGNEPLRNPKGPYGGPVIHSWGRP
jgi:RNA polymerase sigma factor (sigma-70 family)